MDINSMDVDTQIGTTPFFFIPTVITSGLCSILLDLYLDL